MRKTLKFAVLFTIAVVALFALTLLGASAATHASDADAVTAGNIVKIEYTKGGVATTEYYPSINAAVTGAGDAIADGATITVLGNITADAATTISAGNVIINGGGYTATELALTVSGADVVLNGLSIQNSTTMAITLAGGSLEINGTADAPVSVIATKTTKYAIHVSAASTSLKINYATIQGPTAIWLAQALSEGTEISNATVKAVAAGTGDYAFAFYTAVENALTATNCTFQTVVDDNISPATSAYANKADIKGKAVMRNDRACTWTLTDVKIIGTKFTYYTTKPITQLVNGFQVSGNLTIKTGNYTTASVYMETAQHLFFVMTGKTLILQGDSERNVKITHSYNGYYAPINLQGTSKLTMNYADVSALVQPIYVAGAVTINATNSKVHCGGKQNHNGVLYYEGSASTNTVATFTNCTLTSNGYGIEFVTASKTHTINFINTSLTSVKQAFCTNGTGITATINGGNIKGNTAVIVFDKANTTYTLNNVNITGGTLGAVSITATGAVLTINGGSHISENTATLYNITNGATVKINGGYFKTTAADLIAVQGSASLTVYSGYFYRPVSADSCSFIRVAAGTANVYGGTFVADYTDVGTVFMLSDTASALNAAAFNGYGSASIIYDETTGLPTMEQTESFSFNHNTVEIRGNISLRLDATGDVSKSGLRFTSYMTAELLSMIESQKDADTAVSYGTVIVPAKYLAEVDYFSIETVQNALVIPATEKGMLTDELGGIFIRASIYNLPHTSTGSAMTYADDYAFIAYAEYTVNGNTVRHYSAFDYETQTANPAELSYAAANDLRTTQSGAYIHPVLGYTLQYSRYTDNERAVIEIYKSDYIDPALAALQFTFVEQTNSYTVTGYNNSLTELAIPTMYKGYPVTAIAASVFSGCTTLKTVTIPATITSIGTNAFNGCTGLTGVIISDVEAWLNVDFASKTANPLNYAKKLYLGDTELTELVIPESITQIKPYAFYHCTSLQSIHFHAGVTVVGESAFSTTVNVKTLHITDLTAWLKITFANSTAYPLHQSAVSGTAIYLNGSPLVNLVVPDEITEIPSYVFYKSTVLQSVQLHANITSIGGYAFDLCTNLKTINLPANSKLQSIGYEAFRGTAITSFVVPASVSTMGDSVFIDCASLESVSFTAGGKLTALPGYTFRGCLKLKTLILPGAITEIKMQSIKNCPALTTLVVPASVTTIDSTAFVGTASIRHLTAPLGILASIPTTAVETIVVNGGTSIAASAFADNTMLKSVTFETDITSIGNNAFQGCTSLASINIPASVTSIGSGVFSGCTSLAEMTIPFVGSSATSPTYKNFGYLFGATDYSSQSSYIPATLQKVTVTDQCVFDANAFAGTNFTVSVTHILGNTLKHNESYHWHACTRTGCTAVTEDAASHSYNTAGVCTVCSRAYDDLGLTFSFNSSTSTYTVTGYTGSPVDLVIPSQYLGYPVTAIGANAFSGCTTLKTVQLPEGIKTLGTQCFSGCTALVSISIPKTVTSVASNAFYNVNSIVNATVPTAAISALPKTALKTLTINGGTSIPADAFEGNTKLEHLTIGSTVTSVGSEAFHNCTSLKTVYISASVTTMSQSVFHTCSSLTDITFATGSKLKAIPQYLFSDCKKLKSFELPTGITSIGKHAFRNCQSLTQINLPAGVTSIGEKAFYQCYSLSTFEVPSSCKMTTIGDYAFTHTKIAQFNMPATVTSIGTSAFENCYRLEAITIPAGVTKIGDHVFSSCIALESVTFSSTTKLTSIGVNGFYNCAALQSIQIPSSVTNIGTGAFYGCRSLETVKITNLTNWFKIAFGNSDSNPLSNSADLQLNSTPVTSISVPSTITAIKPYALYNCDTLTTITIPSTVKSIGKDAFTSCDALTKVNAASIASWCGITFASANANPLNKDAKLYVGGSLVTDVEIPSTVTAISEWAFYGCDWLTGVHVTDLAAFAQIDFGNFYANPLYYAKKLYLNGTEVTALVLPAGISKIGDHAFVNGAFTAVTLPEGVASIGKNAFNGAAMTSFGGATDTLYYSSFAYCNSLNSVTVPADMIRYLPKNALKTVVISGGTSILSEAFKNCTKLTSITVPASITHMGVDAFSGCTALTNVYITDMAAWCAIDFDSFTANPLHKAKNLYLDGSKVTSVSIPSGVTEIAPFAFYGFKGITSVTIPASVTVIDSYAFTNCTALTTVTFSGTGLTDIQSYAFAGCTALKSFAIPSTVTSIAPYAFSGAGLTSLTGTTTGFKRYSTVSATSGTSATLTYTNLKSTYTAYWWKK